MYGVCPGAECSRSFSLQAANVSLRTFFLFLLFDDGPQSSKSSPTTSCFLPTIGGSEELINFSSFFGFESELRQKPAKVFANTSLSPIGSDTPGVQSHGSWSLMVTAFVCPSMLVSVWFPSCVPHHRQPLVGSNVGVLREKQDVCSNEHQRFLILQPSAASLHDFSFHPQQMFPTSVREQNVFSASSKRLHDTQGWTSSRTSSRTSRRNQWENQ